MNERIKQLIEYYGLSIRAFEQKICVSESLIYRGLSRNSDFGASVLVKILNICSEISPDWLLLGKGEMLRKNVQKNTSSLPDDNTMCEKIIAELRSELATAYRTIGQLEYQLQHEGGKTNSISAQMSTELTSV